MYRSKEKIGNRKSGNCDKREKKGRKIDRVQFACKKERKDK